MNTKITTILLLGLTSMISIGNSTTDSYKEVIESEKAITAAFTIKKYTISNGGGVITSSGNTYKITSSIGQIDAGHNASSVGNTFSFAGGFITEKRTTSTGELVFSNGFE